MKRAILPLLATLFVACERSQSPDVSSAETAKESNTTSNPSMMLSLLQQLPDGKLSPAHGALKASLPCPSIQVSKFEIENLRKDPGNEYGIICDITVSGTIGSALCDILPGPSGVIEQVRIFHNDGDEPLGSFPVEVEKVKNGDVSRPFPFTGHFRFKAEAISVTEGNNTFCVTSRDKVYGLDGHSLWAASFAFSYDNDDESDDAGQVKDPTVVEGPKMIEGGGGGEMYTYCLAIKNDPAKPANMKLAVDGGRHLTFQAVEGTEYLIPVWPDTATPAMFTLRPTMAIQAKVPSDTKVVDALESHSAQALLTPKDQFLYGFSQGLGFEGYDLIFDSDHLIIGGVRLSKNFKALQFSVGLTDESGKSVTGELEAGADKPMGSGSLDSMPNLLWYFAKLFRTNDPRAEEVVMGLLVSDLTEVGLAEISHADWRGYFYRTVSSVMENAITETQKNSEIVAGYYLGRLVGDGLRLHVDPTRSERWDEIGAGDFLLKMTQLPFMNPKQRAKFVPTKTSGVINGLKRFISGKE